MLQILSRYGENVHVLFECAERDKAFGEELARSLLERFGLQICHHFDNACAFPDMRSLVRANKIGDMMQQSVASLGGRIDQVVDGLEYAHFAKQIDLCHRSEEHTSELQSR